ncbi:hypothetical protein Ae201684P_015142 [Aphanomyces euteiches]|uniref:DDE-1 domain-containing protein n=1 Tax=Aphanomyces euteiches TaxID=100861 RepID=A0A6G0XI39_9STRA|nr:hypothetical protein Ae201684_004691 [Aphanomyces euteiches]KAH9073327.1 hypothetical protein Ae201684P_015142 [Aphanomyces euteiches]KAH9142966.1 hypothetical protein AeRB84_013000 [Aphanomyces euteiches]
MGKVKRSFDVTTKLEAIEYAKKFNNHQAAKKFKASRSTIQDWRRQEEDLHKLVAKNRQAKRLSGGGRPLTSVEHEEILFERILYERSLKLRVTRSMILIKGWLERFLERHDFVLRQPTRKQLPTDEQVVERALSFYNTARHLINVHGLTPDCIYNLDETAIFFDHDKSTIDIRGAHDVAVRSFGFEKARITAVFCANANGQKKKPCLLVKPGPNIPECICESHDYLEFEFRYHRPPLLLILDSARSHISRRVDDFLHANNILYAFIPSGLTPYLQPADVSWFHTVKSRLAVEIDNWKVNGPFSRTPSDRIRPPSHEIYSSWVRAAWGAGTTDVIKKSFVCCVTGEVADLGLSNHESLGALFRSRAAQLLSNSDAIDLASDEVDPIADALDNLLTIDDE